MKRLLKFLDYFFVLKPMLFLPVWAVFLSGHYAQRATALNSSGEIRYESLLWIGAALTLLAGATAILKQIRDRQSGTMNVHVPYLIADGYLTPKTGFIEALTLISLAVVIGLVFSPIVAALLVVILVISGYLYNFSPFNWKDKPIAALSANAVVALLWFSAGWFQGGAFSMLLAVRSAPYILTIVAIYLLTTLSSADASGPAPASSSSFAGRYGAKTTAYLAVMLQTVSLATAFILADELIFYPTFFSLPFFVWAAVRLQVVEVFRAVKYTIFFLALAVAVKWSVIYSQSFLFILLLAIYLLSKVYYKHRLGLEHPNIAA